MSLENTQHTLIVDSPSRHPRGAVLPRGHLVGRVARSTYAGIVVRPVLIGIVLVALTACATAARERAPSVADIVRAATPTPAPTTPSDAPGKREVKEAVLSAQARLALLKSYRARVVDEAGETQAVFEYIRPDRYRQVTDTEEQIGIGDMVYTRDGNGPWTKDELPGIGRVANEVTVAPEFFWDVEAQGQETVSSVTCNKYAVVLRIGSTEYRDQYWVGTEDNLPHKMITQVDTQTTVIKLLYDFNADFKIESPMPE